MAADIANVTEPNAGTRAVLIVENHDEVRELIARMVTLQGWRPIKAASIAEAIDCLRRGGIDAIIADWQLDDGDGEYLLRQACGGAPRLEIPTVMISSYASPELRALARAAGALDLLEKPFRFEHLTRLLDRQLAALPAPVVA